MIDEEQLEDEPQPLCSCWGFNDCDGGGGEVRCRIQEAEGPVIL